MSDKRLSVRGRIVVLAILLLLGSILVPYLCSRGAAPFRRVSTFETGQSTETKPSGGLRVASYNIAHGRGLAVSNWMEEGRRPGWIG